MTDPEMSLTGMELQELVFDRDGSGIWVQRDGGLEGSALTEDIATGRWRDHLYRLAKKAEQPGPDWFEIEALLERVAEIRSATRKAAGWRVEGVVIIDSGAVAVAVTAAVRRLDPTEPPPDGPDIYLYRTMADLNLPVETRSIDGDIVEVRVDVVDDVDEIETDGHWHRIGDLDVDDEGVVFFDPYTDTDTDRNRVAVRPGPGIWKVSILNVGHDELSLRLIPARSDGG